MEHEQKHDEGSGQENGSDKHDDAKHLVVFNLDGKDREIEKGKYQVSWLKDKFGIPQDYELDLVVEGTFEPLANDASIKIHGGEVLVSHVRGGGSS